MAEAHELQFHKMGETNGIKETFSLEDNSFPNEMNQSLKKKRYLRWFLITLYATLMLVGQPVATLLGRLYFEKGGKSKWIGTLVQLIAFPILLPYYFFISSPPKNSNTNNSNSNTLHHQNQPSNLMLAFVYVSIGLLVALDCYLYSFGLLYLPVSCYTLICSSQLAFNALFSYFLNSLKFTPYTINSIFLLTTSSSLLVFQNEESQNSTKISNKMYAIGFICTVAASAGYGLILSLTQLAFNKVMKSKNFKVVMDMIIYQSLVATCATLVGFFASGEWSGIKKEMEVYEMGKASYVLTLAFTALTWQLYCIGCIGLIFEVSSLFSNAISVLGLPIVSILAIVVFQDKMHGIKAISMVLAVWGFVSYLYQQYLDEYSNSNTENRNTCRVHKASSPIEEGNLDEL